MADEACVEEPAKKVPVVRDVDVVVAGAGISGLLAALSAGRSGARTVLVDRFGTVGGSIGGAGMFMACNGPDLTGNAKGALIYSLGDNEKDDGGELDWSERKDDIAFKLSVEPARKPGEKMEPRQ